MTEKELRQKVVSIMQGWLGCKESNGSHKKIIDIYNSHKPLAQGYKVKYTDSWCATAASAAFIKAGLTDIAPTECSCGRMIELYKAKGWWKETDSYKPAPGDLIMYDWDDTGRGENKGAPEHVGIVVSVSGNTIKVIEGNKNNAVEYRTITVNGKYIRGYCLPNYASKAEKVATKEKIAKTDPAKYFERAYAKTYSVNVSALNMRSGAGTHKSILKCHPRGSKLTCYGYYSTAPQDKSVWLYVKDKDGDVGFCTKKYLK